MAFFNDITLGHFYPTGSCIHRLDPRTKLIAIMAVMISLLITRDIRVLGTFVVFSIFVIRISKIPAVLVFKNLKPFLWLFILTICIHVFFTDGRAIAEIPVFGIRITEEGLILGSLYSARLALLIVFAAMLTLSTSPIELTDALEKLFAPLKKLHIPTHEIVMMMTLSLRFIPTLMEEAERLQKAQVSRGATFEGSLIQRVKSVIPLILPLFISAFRRADELALAMDSRCYAGGEGRSSYKKLEFHLADYIVTSFSGAITILIFMI